MLVSPRIRFCFWFVWLVLAAFPILAADGPSKRDEPLTAVLAGEYALQSGKLDEAAKWYLQAAKSAKDDPAMAERAVRIALLAKDDKRAHEALTLWRRRADISPAMRAAEATLALRRKDENGAKRELKALLRLPGDVDDDDAGWRYALAALDAGAGDPQLTGRMLESLIEGAFVPNALGPWLAFGEFAQQLQRKDLTEKVVAQVIARFPEEPAAALLQASQLRDSGKPDEARKVLAGLAKTLPSQPELVLAVAREYGALGDHAAAADLLAHGPQNDRIYAIRAGFLAEAKDKSGIDRLYEEMKRDSNAPDPNRRLLLGQIAEFTERYPEALDWYASVPGGPQRWQARMRAASVLHKLKRSGEAFARLRELQADAGADDETRRDAYLLEAELRKDDKDRAGEIDSYARGLAAYPDDPALLYGRALMWERYDDIPRAEADLRKILVADADDVNALNALGYTLADRTDRYQEALELIARAIAAEPDNAAIIDSYGWVLYRLGRHEQALAELRRAYLKQKDAEIAAHLAEVLWVRGLRDEARKYFQESRKLDPENRSLKRALEKTGADLPPPEKAEQ